MESVFRSRREGLKRKAARRAGGRRIGRVCGVFLSAALVFQLLSAGGATAYASEETTVLGEPDTGRTVGNEYDMHSESGREHTAQFRGNAVGYVDAYGSDSLPENRAVQDSGLGNAFNAGQPDGGDNHVIFGRNLTGGAGEDVTGDSVEKLIEALPDEVTADNADAVRGQLEEILALYAELTEAEQGQIDILRCLELQAALEQSQGLMPSGTDLAAEGDASGTDGAVKEVGVNLDFSSTVTYPGSLDTDGYQWDVSDSSNKKLKLKNVNITGTVSLPDDTVTIEVEGECSIGELAIVGNPNQTKLIFSGADKLTDKLTIGKQISICGGDNNSLTVDKDVHVIAKGGINIGGSGGTNSTVTVSGTLTAVSTDKDTNAISAGKVTVKDGGLMKVSGMNGLVLHGMSSQGTGFTVADAFTIEENGCFDGECKEFHIRVVSLAPFYGNGEEQAFNFSNGAGEIFLPSNCKISIEESRVILENTDIKKEYSGKLIIHENHDWQGINKKDEFEHWEECEYKGCNKINGAKEVHSYNTSTWLCTACGARLTMTLKKADGLFYEGDEKMPVVSVEVDGNPLTSGYDTSYSNNINAGTASVTIKGKDGQTFERTEEFKIAKAKPTIAWGDDNKQTVTYTGRPAEITAPRVALVKNESFIGKISYSYAANSRADYTPGLPTNAGTYSVIASIEEQGNYTAAESGILSLTVEQAENAPNMPSDTMNVARKYDKVGAVELPENWQWQEAYRDTPLEIGVPLAATAVYEGEDKANYKNVSVTVIITRLTATPEPTATPAPTATPEPTATPVPTATPAPTATPEIEKPAIRDDSGEESRETSTEETYMAEARSPHTGQPRSLWQIMAVCALAIVMGIGGFFLARRKRGERDR